MSHNQTIDGVPRDPCQWTDLQILDFLGVALRDVDLVGTVKLSEIRPGFEDMRAQSGAEQPAPVNTLKAVLTSLKEACESGVIIDTLWLTGPCSETLFDYLERMIETERPAPVAVVRCSFCDITDQDGNPWSGGSATQDGILIYRVIGCKDHKHLADACLAEVTRLNPSL